MKLILKESCLAHCPNAPELSDRVFRVNDLIEVAQNNADISELGYAACSGYRRFRSGDKEIEQCAAKLVQYPEGLPEEQDKSACSILRGMPIAELALDQLSDS